MGELASSQALQFADDELPPLWLTGSHAAPLLCVRSGLARIRGLTFDRVYLPERRLVCRLVSCYGVAKPDLAILACHLTI